MAHRIPLARQGDQELEIGPRVRQLLSGTDRTLSGNDEIDVPSSIVAGCVWSPDTISTGAKKAVPVRVIPMMVGIHDARVNRFPVALSAAVLNAFA